MCDNTAGIILPKVPKTQTATATVTQNTDQTVKTDTVLQRAPPKLNDTVPIQSVDFNNMILQPVDLNQQNDDDLFVRVLDSFEKQLSMTSVQNVQNVHQVTSAEAMVQKMYFGNSTITIN